VPCCLPGDGNVAGPGPEKILKLAFTLQPLHGPYLRRGNERTDAKGCAWSL
jgi:hypothetical protein